MPLRLDSQNADFAERFRSLLALKREAAQDVEQAAHPGHVDHDGIVVDREGVGHAARLCDSQAELASRA